MAAAGHGSVRLQAQRLADRVVKLLGAMDGDAPDDPLKQLIQIASTIAPLPAETLATSSEIDTAALIRDRRLARFEARGCQQLSAEAWKRETAEILDEIRIILAARYARALREYDCARKPYLSKSGAAKVSIEGD